MTYVLPGSDFGLEIDLLVATPNELAGVGYRIGEIHDYQGVVEYAVMTVRELPAGSLETREIIEKLQLPGIK